MINWVSVREYYDQDSMLQAQAVLQNANIPYEVSSPDTHLNSAYGQGTSHSTVLLVLEEHFDKADELIEKTDDGTEAEGVPLSDYTTDELKEIVLNPRDWHSSFVISAREKLKKLGMEITDQAQLEHQEKKTEKLRQGQDPNKLLFYTMWVLAAAGGLIGIISGLSYWLGTVKGDNGERYHAYSQKYRIQGMIMFLTGIGVLLLSIAAFFQIRRNGF